MERAVRRPSRDEVISLLSALVAIDSINPVLVPGAAGEEKIAAFVAGWLSDAGIEAELQPVEPDRPNVVARVDGRGGPTLLLNAHLDTVGVAGMAQPFEPRVEGDRLYGRGAYDMKAGLAAIMLAAKLVHTAGGGSGDLLVTAVVDEELASAGTRAILDRYGADAAIVTEPTGLRLCVAHKGFAWYEIETRGVAAHGSRPDLGVDAIAMMGRVLVELEELGRRLAGGPPHHLLGTGSLHASLIEGGQELSSYPERCRLQVERRTIPGESRESVRQEVAAIFAELTNQDPRFVAGLELSLWREPFEVAVDQPVVAAIAGMAADVLGSTPEWYGDTPWMDAALTSAAGILTVVFGPGGGGAHAVVEYASLDEVALCAEILAKVSLGR